MYPGKDGIDHAPGAHDDIAKKAWVTGQTDDLSLKTLLLFAAGLVLWIAYGFLQTDFVIILGNGISLLILSVLLYLKLTQRPTHSVHQ